MEEHALAAAQISIVAVALDSMDEHVKLRSIFAPLVPVTHWDPQNVSTLMPIHTSNATAEMDTLESSAKLILTNVPAIHV